MFASCRSKIVFYFSFRSSSNGIEGWVGGERKYLSIGDWLTVDYFRKVVSSICFWVFVELEISEAAFFFAFTGLRCGLR
jgi:hypothetical protein